MDSERLRNPRSALLPAVAIFLVAAIVIVALIIAGSPAEQRRRWADNIRVNDLQAIKKAIDQFYGKRKRLPESLAQLQQNDEAGRYEALHIADAETKQPYMYRILSPNEYELGAVFLTDTARGADSGVIHRERDWPVDRSMPFWKHTAGSVNFRLKVEK